MATGSRSHGQPIRCGLLLWLMQSVLLLRRAEIQIFRFCLSTIKPIQFVDRQIGVRRCYLFNNDCWSVICRCKEAAIRRITINSSFYRFLHYEYAPVEWLK